MVAATDRRTYPKCAVPGSGAKCHAIGTDAKAADTVLVAGKNTNTLALERIPDIASPVVVTAKEDTA